MVNIMYKQSALFLLGMIVISGCGGSNSSKTPLDNASQIPLLLSEANIQTFAENSTSVVYQATVTDGSIAVWSLSGQDGALLSIAPDSGEVRFKNPPDYESPRDANADNQYEIIVSSDAAQIKSQTLVIQILNEEDANIVADKFVAMRDLSSDGTRAWLFEPGFIKLTPGEVLEFTPIATGHDSISKVTPNGAAGWKTKLDGGKVKLQQQGVYIYHCEPHGFLGMWGIVQVGDASINKEAARIKMEELIISELLTVRNGNRLRAAFAKID